MKVAAVQHDVVWEDPAANFARLEPMIAHAAADDVRLVVLTEMYATGFSMETERIAEPFDGPGARFLEAQAARARFVGVRVGARAPARARSPVELPRPGRTRWHRAPVLQDPPVHVFRRGRVSTTRATSS